MKIIFLKIALIAGISFGLQFILPWWIIVIVAFAIELLFGGKTSLSFFSGFYGVFIYWFMYAGIIDFQNGFLLSKKIALLFHLPQMPLIVALVTALLGGIIGGMGSLTGNLFRKMFNV
ncbi:MAG: hypothetical protein POELPBGB_03417 [Bacteroidia bacterium]|nr:hypothetical protein [Bacteroidia bacterium]